jgi:hypothetical protein
MRIGYFLSCEAFGPAGLLAQARLAEDTVADSVVCGPDIDAHVANLQEHADAGIDEVFVQQIGFDHEAFFDAYREHVLPRF